MDLEAIHAAIYVITVRVRVTNMVRVSIRNGVPMILRSC